MRVIEMTDKNVLRTTFCSNPNCSERVEKFGDDIYRVQTPGDIAAVAGNIYCSARCVARGMADEPGVDRVNVYDAGQDNSVTPGGVVDD